MRWMKRRDRDRGATAVMVAITAVILMGFAALAVDVGRLYWERRQLQNGADLAALSIAESCARSLANADCTNPQAAGEDLANKNSNDTRSRASVSLDTAQGRVQVDTAASEVGAPANSISMTFARVLGIDAEDVGASAVARWGSPSGTDGAFPLAFSLCQIDVTPTIDGQLQYLLSHGVQEADGADQCYSNSAGHSVPGGFGWLIPTAAGTCAADTQIGDWSGGETGNKSGLSAACETVLSSWITKLDSGETVTALFPVFDDVDKFNKSYRIYAYAAVEIHGWHFDTLANPKPPQDYLPGTMSDLITDAGYGNSDLGFVIKFVRFIFTDEGTDVTPTPSPYGANVVVLTD